MKLFWFGTKTHEMEQNMVIDFVVENYTMYPLPTHGLDMMSTKGEKFHSNSRFQRTLHHSTYNIYHLSSNIYNNYRVVNNNI